MASGKLVITYPDPVTKEKGHTVVQKSSLTSRFEQFRTLVEGFGTVDGSLRATEWAGNHITIEGNIIVD